MIKAKITVTLKNGVLDPQGKAIEGSLAALGFSGVDSVRQGKIFDVDLREKSKPAAMKKLNAMCEQLLANQVIEDFVVEIVG